MGAVTQQGIMGGFKDDTEIYRPLTKALTEELKVLLSGTVAGPSVSGSISLDTGKILYEHIRLWNRTRYLNCMLIH
jgi:hypothetical protein